MLKKYRKHIFAILAILLATVVILGIITYSGTPKLSKWEKEKVVRTYLEEWRGGDEKEFARRPLIWYDENGYIEKPGVWRYVGRYGFCYAFLMIEDDTDNSGIGMGLPREVDYPREAAIILYHTIKEFPTNEVFGYDSDSGERLRMTALSGIKNRKDWISDAQLERLTRDVEKIAKDYSSISQPSVPLIRNPEKKAVRQEYFDRYCRGEIQHYLDYPVTWYDENGYIEEENVWRYVGKYGGCYAFLRIGDNKNLNGKPTPDPYPLRGLARVVFYPNEAEVYLYHSYRDFEIETGYGIITTRIAELYEIKMELQNREKWLTDEQYEQLTQDIEKLAKDYN